MTACCDQTVTFPGSPADQFFPQTFAVASVAVGLANGSVIVPPYSNILFTYNPHWFSMLSTQGSPVFNVLDGISPGVTKIILSYQRVNATLRITVADALNITITPESSTTLYRLHCTPLFESVAFRAEAYIVPVGFFPVAATFSLSHPGVASLSGSIVTGQVPGQTDVMAAWWGLTATYAGVTILNTSLVFSALYSPDYALTGEAGTGQEIELYLIQSGTNLTLNYTDFLPAPEFIAISTPPTVVLRGDVLIAVSNTRVSDAGDSLQVDTVLFQMVRCQNVAPACTAKVIVNLAPAAFDVDLGEDGAALALHPGEAGSRGTHGVLHAREHMAYLKDLLFAGEIPVVHDVPDPVNHVPSILDPDRLEPVVVVELIVIAIDLVDRLETDLTRDSPCLLAHLFDYVHHDFVVPLDLVHLHARLDLVVFRHRFVTVAKSSVATIDHDSQHSVVLRRATKPALIRSPVAGFLPLRLNAGPTGVYAFFIELIMTATGCAASDQWTGYFACTYDDPPGLVQLCGVGNSTAGVLEIAVITSTIINTTIGARVETIAATHQKVVSAAARFGAGTPSYPAIPVAPLVDLSYAWHNPSLYICLVMVHKLRYIEAQMVYATDTELSLMFRMTDRAGAPDLNHTMLWLCLDQIIPAALVWPGALITPDQGLIVPAPMYTDGW